MYTWCVKKIFVLEYYSTFISQFLFHDVKYSFFFFFLKKLSMILLSNNYYISLNISLINDVNKY